MLRVIAHLLLALSLTLTSVTAAVAHMRAAGAQQIVLCGQPGVEQTITLDAFGDPIDTTHHCPDCLAVTAGTLPERPVLLRPVTRAERQVPHIAALPLSGPEVTPGARGPPRLI